MNNTVCARCHRKIQDARYRHKIIFQELTSKDDKLKSSKSFNLCFECMQEIQEIIFED